MGLFVVSAESTIKMYRSLWPGSDPDHRRAGWVSPVFPSVAEREVVDGTAKQNLSLRRKGILDRS